MAAKPAATAAMGSPDNAEAIPTSGRAVHIPPRADNPGTWPRPLPPRRVRMEARFLLRGPWLPRDPITGGAAVLAAPKIALATSSRENRKLGWSPLRMP